MEFKKAVDRLLKSKEFKEWKHTCKNSHLAHGFISVDDNDQWQIGYYNKETDKITSFVMGSEIVINPEENIFKEEHTEVKELDLDKINVDESKALEIAENLQQTYYSSDPPMKKILIIQNIDLGQIWNITFITRTFKTLNMKIDAETGRIIEHKATSIMQFRS